MKYFAILSIAIFASVNPLYANYNANISGVVTNVLTYDSGLILFRLDNQPSSHPTCKATYFAIALDVKDVAVSRMLSRLLTAHTTKTSVNIGFDNTADCGNGYIRVHRVG